MKKKAFRKLIAQYMVTEGCSCCEDDAHSDLQDQICIELGIPPFKDGSGYDYWAVARGEEDDA